jgi:arsenite methyltransferase
MNNHNEGGIMSTLSFAGDMARLQRAFAESHDSVVRRCIVLETLNLRTSERV